MGKRMRKLRNVRIHHEGTAVLIWSAAAIAAVGAALWFLFDVKIPFWVFAAVALPVYLIALNFFRCPMRYFPSEVADGLVVAPADGRVVVVEEVDEKEYFNEPRLMISIFMSLFNVHANWFPVEGKVKMVRHRNGNFMKAWLPKASEENERADVIITTPQGVDVLCRQVAGAVARRIVTYAKEGEECYIDEHMGFIKFGSRVDVFLPKGSVPLVKLGQATTGDITTIARLPV